ncbi:MAG TPA: radical SAM family heme chaperone HemW [Mycobacteriales bacterium]|nr:radical SAM family heme chaperone HemW [Mycobacteriales bacterium]
MPSPLPDGEPAPTDGGLPAVALAELGQRPFGVYIHVPFCASRCGYCDFNTYTAGELGGGASLTDYAATAAREFELAARVLGRDRPRATTVFFGGGTPTLLPAEQLRELLGCARVVFGFTADVEVTTEANPESVDPRYLGELRAAGFTRISFGMQSAQPHVLAVLDREHSAGRAGAAVAEAREAGFDHVNVDLIYGTPGETDEDWRASLEAAVDTGADHVSAYSLIVEPGTRLAARVARGELPAPDDDVLADRYATADEMLSAAGFEWYEVSNWARGPGSRSRHNLLYWTGADWWGFGPGAHSHVGGVRWWNVKHPRDYAARLAVSHSPAAAREILTKEDQRVERVMLAIRLRDGLRLEDLGEQSLATASQLAADGLLQPAALEAGEAILTFRGRLLADAVVRAMIAS